MDTWGCFNKVQSRASVQKILKLHLVCLAAATKMLLTLPPVCRYLIPKRSNMAAFLTDH